MPATTSAKNLPYPLGTDRLMDGDDAIHSLAAAVDNMVQTGLVTLTPVTANVVVTATVTIPVAYAAAPMIQLSMLTGSGLTPGGASWWVKVGPTTTSFVVSLNATALIARNLVWLTVGKVV